MSSDPKPEPKQKTAKGLEIRVPTRKEFFRNLKKTLKPRSAPNRPKQ